MVESPVTYLHDRRAAGRRWVYFVRSRRAGGLSVGVNLDPQRTCNFDCVYCEVVDRGATARRLGRPRVPHDEVATELAALLDALRLGPEPVRSLAFAGDGEPSTFRGLRSLAERLFDVRDAAGLAAVPVVLVTNGSGLGRREMFEAHDLFAARGGVFWVKLDAGTEGFYRVVCRTAVPFERVLANLARAARRHPVVVQSMFFRSAAFGPPPPGEVAAWARRLASVVRGGGALAGVHVYTVARPTTEEGIHPLGMPELEAIADAARTALPGVPVAAFA